MSVGTPSSLGAVDPFADLSDLWISSSVMGCHRSSRGARMSESSSGSSIFGKKVSRKACAFSLFSVSSLVATCKAGIHP
jgi:hypothetical protein